MLTRILLWLTLCGLVTVATPAQEAGIGESAAPIPSEASGASAGGPATASPAAAGAGAMQLIEFPTKKSFQWQSATRQSIFFLGMQHSLRLTQVKTRRELGGPFIDDYFRSVKGIREWDDGDDFITNYIGHPMQGAITGYIAVQNDPRGIYQQFSTSSDYWKSRFRALAWSALYSTQFEIGPFSEASLGNVGMKPGTSGAVDLVMTPVGGLGWMIGEDALDRLFIRRVERGRSKLMKRFYRIALNPTRSVANIARLKHPWHRDTRGMDEDHHATVLPDSTLGGAADSRAARK